MAGDEAVPGGALSSDSVSQALGYDMADRRIATLLPQERRLIRRGGAWREEPYTLFRGYVFVDTEAPLPIYYTVRGQDGVMRWLGASPGTPEALSLAEAVNIRWLAGQDLRPSTAREVIG